MSGKLCELEGLEVAISSEIERLVLDDIEAAIEGRPIAHSVRINRLGQDRNIIQAAIARARQHEQR